MWLRLHTYPVLGDRQLRTITSAVVQDWVRGMHGQLAPRYVQMILGNLSTVLASAIDDGLIAKNPCKAKSVSAPKVKKSVVVPWPAEWVAEVRNAMPVRYREMVTAGAGLGLRQGEIFGLAKEDVDWLRHVVHVRRQVKIVGRKLVFAPPKGDKDRNVPLPTSVSLRLAHHLQEFPAAVVTLPWRVPAGKLTAAHLVFTSPSAVGAISRNRFNESVWQPSLKAAGVPRGRENGCHALRHYFASVVLDGGESIKALAEWLGHDDPGFTLRTYTHLLPASNDRMRQAIDRAFAERGVPDVRHGNA